MYRILAARLADDAYRLAIGVTREAAGIVNQRTDTLRGLHLVVHGALYLTCDVDQTVVGAYHDDVVVAQADIAAQLAVEDVVVDVDGANQTVVAVYLNITECTNVVRTTSHIQGMEYGGKGCQCVGARCLYLTHHVDGDGARLTYRQAYLTAAVAGSQLRADAAVGLSNGETCHLNGTIAFNHYKTVG